MATINTQGIGNQNQVNSGMQQLTPESIKAELMQLVALQTQQISLMQQLVQSNNNASAMASKINTVESANFQQYPQNINFQPASIQGSYNNNQQSFQSTMASLGGRNNNYGFMDGLMPATSRMSAQSQALMSMDFGNRAGQAAIAGMGAAGATAFSFGLPTIMKGLPGIGMGMFGGAAVGLMADSAVNEMKKQNSYEKYIFKNSNRFINPDESNNKRGLGGFSINESRDAASHLRTINDNLYLKDEEMMSLVQKFTEGGMLKDTKDLKGFKDKVESLSKTVKSGAIMLNDTYDNIADLMSELRKMGLDQRDFSEIMGLGNLAGVGSGVDGTQNLNNTMDIVNRLNYGTSNNSGASMTRFFDTQIYMNKLDDQLTQKPVKNETEQMIQNMIKNFGGVDKAAQELQVSLEKLVDSNTMVTNPALAFFDWSDSDNSFKFNNSEFQKFLQGEYSISELNSVASTKLQGNDRATEHWMSSGSTYIKNNLQDGDMSKYIDTVLESYQRDVSYSNLDQRGVLGLLGVKDSNMQNFMSGFLDYREYLGDSYGNKARQQVSWQTAMSEKKAETPSLKETFNSGIEKVKDFFTAPFVGLGNKVNEGILKMTDKWYGFDENKITRYDEFFSIKSNVRSMSSENIIDELNQANEVISSSLSSLNKMTDRGFNINTELYDIVKNKYDNTEKSVKYDRAIIKNWDQLEESVQKDKDKIVGLAKEADLSETIVAALLKFNQRHPDNEKLTKGDMQEFTSALGKLNFDYGGNTELALAARFTNKSDIDAQLKAMGYDIEGLRSVGAQELLKDVNLGDLNLGEEISNKVKEVINESLGGGVSGGTGNTQGGSGEYVTLGKEDIKNLDLRTKSNVTADDINQIIASNAKAGSKMIGTGEAFIQASNETGVDALYLMAHAAQETGWGNSNIVRDKNNFFGIGAFNSSPYASSYGFTDTTTGIIEGSKWISDKYINSDKYNQHTLEKMVGVEGHRYAVYDDGTPNSGWVDGISSIIAKGLEKTGKGYDSAGATNTSGGKATSKVDPLVNYEAVYKDHKGKKLSEEERKQEEKNQRLREGFSTGTDLSKNLSGFVKNTSSLYSDDNDIEKAQEEML
ncbi:MAG: N-acetylglucosaminidase, partial [Paraclostridium sp.]